MERVRTRVLMLIPKVELSSNGVLVGGSVNILKNLCAAMKESGKWIATVLTSSSNEARRLLKEYPQSWADIIVLNNSKRPQSTKFGLTYLLKVTLHCVIRRMNDVAIVHGHSGYAIYAWATVFVGRILRAPTVHTVYCPVDHKSAVGGRAPIALQARWARGALRRLDRIVAISENIAASLTHLGVPRSKIVVIPPSIDVARFKPDGHSERSKFCLPENVPLLLYVGNLMPAKGFDIVLDALPYIVERVPNIHLVATLELKHAAFNEQKERCDSRLRTMGLVDKVHFRGFVEDMPGLMRTATIFVTPYISTQGPSDYPLAMMEAMSCGKSVVATNVGGIPEVVRSAGIGSLVEPGDARSLARGICEVLEQDLQVAGKRAADFIMETYSPEENYKRHTALYEELVPKAEQHE